MGVLLFCSSRTAHLAPACMLRPARHVPHATCSLQKDKLAAEEAEAERLRSSAAETATLRAEASAAEQRVQAAQVPLSTGSSRSVPNSSASLLFCKATPLPKHEACGPGSMPSLSPSIKARPPALFTNPVLSTCSPFCVQDDCRRLEQELREYKARAHALLKAKENELRAARDMIKCAACCLPCCSRCCSCLCCLHRLQLRHAQCQ